MALHERISLQVRSLGIRTELNAAGVYAAYGGGLRKCSFPQSSMPLANGELQPESNTGGLDRKQFPDVPLPIPPCQLSPACSFRADHHSPQSAKLPLTSLRMSVRTAAFRGQRNQ